MRWDFVFEHCRTRLLADALLESVMDGTNFVYPAQAGREVTVPSIEYLLIYDREEELFNPIGLQVDFWIKGLAKARQVERRIRLLTHSDVGQDLGGERMWIRFLDGRQVLYPKDPGVVHKILDFEAKPMRELYAEL